MAKRIAWTREAKADLRAIEQQTAMQILRTLARYARTGEGNVKPLRGIEPPLLRLRAQQHRVFLRAEGEYLEISRVFGPQGSVPLTPRWNNPMPTSTGTTVLRMGRTRLSVEERDALSDAERAAVAEADQWLLDNRHPAELQRKGKQSLRNAEGFAV